MARTLAPADYALMLIAWMSISVSSVLVLLSGATSLQAAFWRVFLGGIITILLTRSPPPQRYFTKRMIIVAGGLLALHFLTWMESLFHIPVALSTTIVVTYPLFLTITDSLIMKEKPTLRQVAGMLTAFTGVAVMTLSGEALSPTGGWLTGVTLALIGALAAAGYFAIGRIERSGGAELSHYTSSVYLWSALFLLAYSTTWQKPLLPHESTTWAYLLALALVPMLGGHSLMNYLLKKTSSSTVTSIALGEPAGATLLAWLLLGQTPTPTILAGMALTILGIAVALSGAKQITPSPKT